jgi:hypothetical protein
MNRTRLIRRISPISPILSLAVFIHLTLQAAEFSTTLLPDRLIITHGTNPIAHFVFADTNILRPYFAPPHLSRSSPLVRFRLSCPEFSAKFNSPPDGPMIAISAAAP